MRNARDSDQSLGHRTFIEDLKLAFPLRAGGTV
jgi:hypothetical protein